MSGFNHRLPICSEHSEKVTPIYSRWGNVIKSSFFHLIDMNTSNYSWFEGVVVEGVHGGGSKGGFI